MGVDGGLTVVSLTGWNWSEVSLNELKGLLNGIGVGLTADGWFTCWFLEGRRGGLGLAGLTKGRLSGGGGKLCGEW